mmetsp:Transcript_41089/g.86964  ORF Transcript_41089/g.86964 Transcript_41089/m.86964 type:complete len:367 (+) Transcript_41089:314-1414(+)
MVAPHLSVVQSVNQQLHLRFQLRLGILQGLNGVVLKLTMLNLGSQALLKGRTLDLPPLHLLEHLLLGLLLGANNRLRLQKGLTAAVCSLRHIGIRSNLMAQACDLTPLLVQQLLGLVVRGSPGLPQIILKPLHPHYVLLDQLIFLTDQLCVRLEPLNRAVQLPRLVLQHFLISGDLLSEFQDGRIACALPHLLLQSPHLYVGVVELSLQALPLADALLQAGGELLVLFGQLLQLGGELELLLIEPLDATSLVGPHLVNFILLVSDRLAGGIQNLLPLLQDPLHFHDLLLLSCHLLRQLLHQARHPVQLPPVHLVGALHSTQLLLALRPLLPRLLQGLLQHRLRDGRFLLLTLRCAKLSLQTCTLFF